MPLPTETMEERFDEYDYFELPKGMDRVEGTKYSENYPPMQFLAKQINLKALIQSELSLSQNRILEEVATAYKNPTISTEIG